MIPHRSSYLRSAAVRRRSAELITCEDTVCFSPPLLAPALVRAPLEVLLGMRNLLLLFTALCGVRFVWYTPLCALCVRRLLPTSLFLNRTEELECLKRLLSSPPNRTCITVIVGPKSCSKTALMQHFISELKQQKSQQAPSSLEQPLYINCRLEDVSTPDSFACTLLFTTVSAGEQFKAALAALAMAALSGLSNKLMPGHQTVELKLSSVVELIGKLKAVPGTPVASVLNTFQQALQQTFEGHPRPPIIIDEANKLTSWSVTHPEELRTLLSFFVAVTKEQNTTHVVLMTSDYALISWLEKGEHTVFSGPHGCCQVVP